MTIHNPNAMNGEVIESRHFREAGDWAKETVRQYGDVLDSDAKRSLEIQALQSDNLKRVEAVYGRKYNPVRNGDPRVAAAIKRDASERFIAVDTLNNLDMAMKAMEHEETHYKTRDFMKLGDNEHIEVFEEQYEVIDEELKELGVQMETIDWVEAFTDMLSQRKHGRNEYSGYNEREVPAAENLEKLCVDMTGESLLDAFADNNVPEFQKRLQRLGEVLLMRKAFDEIAQESSDPVEMEDLEHRVMEEMDIEKPMARTHKEAKRFTEKLIWKVLALRDTRGLLEHPPMNDNALDVNSKYPSESIGLAA